MIQWCNITYNLYVAGTAPQCNLEYNSGGLCNGRHLLRVEKRIAVHHLFW